MQAIWGTHGDHPVIVLTASNVRDAFDMTVQRVQSRRAVPGPGRPPHGRECSPTCVRTSTGRSRARSPSSNAQAPPTSRASSPSRARVPALRSRRPLPRHRPCARPRRLRGQRRARVASCKRAWSARCATTCGTLAMFDRYLLDDATIALVAYGITSRPAQSAVDLLRARESRRAAQPQDALAIPRPPHPRGRRSGRDHRRPRVEHGPARPRNRALRRGHVRASSHLSRVDGHLLTPRQIAEASPPQQQSKGGAGMSEDYRKFLVRSTSCRTSGARGAATA
jgi:2-oxoglutarate ferredoxin oxidoreductase subunit alpha